LELREVALLEGVGAGDLNVGQHALRRLLDARAVLRRQSITLFR
jgi:hypothetical protein